MSGKVPVDQQFLKRSDPPLLAATKTFPKLRLSTCSKTTLDKYASIAYKRSVKEKSKLVCITIQVQMQVWTPIFWVQDQVTILAYYLKNC